MFIVRKDYNKPVFWGSSYILKLLIYNSQLALKPWTHSWNSNSIWRKSHCIIVTSLCIRDVI